MRKRRPPKVVYRKLGREQAWGMAIHDGRTGEIFIDPRLSPRRELEVICHEQLHISLPNLSEREIDRLGKEVSDTLWRLNFRKVLLGKHTTPVKITK